MAAMAFGITSPRKSRSELYTRGVVKQTLSEDVLLRIFNFLSMSGMRLGRNSKSGWHRTLHVLSRPPTEPVMRKVTDAATAGTPSAVIWRHRRVALYEYSLALFYPFRPLRILLRAA